MRRGDIIVAVDGDAISDGGDLQRIMRTKRVGDTMTLTVLRNGTRTTAKLTLQAMPQ